MKICIDCPESPLEFYLKRQQELKLQGIEDENKDGIADQLQPSQSASEASDIAVGQRIDLLA